MSWHMGDLSQCAKITKYQIYAYIEKVTDAPSTEIWKPVGEVDALPLPMAITFEKVLFLCTSWFIFCLI